MSRALRFAPLLALPLLLVVAAGCGISLSADEDESEIFRALSVEGELTAGGEVTLTLAFEQPYPVDVAVECDLLAAEERTRALVTPPAETPAAASRRPDTVLLILAESLPANPQGGPVGEATPAPGTLERSFSLPDLPGRYRVECFTPAEPRNTIGQAISVQAEAGATSTAGP